MIEYVFISGNVEGLWEISRPPQTEYSLTEKGMALEPILAHIAAFSSRFEPKTIFKDGRPRTSLKQIFGAERLSEVYDY